MRYAIVSTYPAQGSRNVGDALISAATSEFLLKHDPHARIEEIWRAAAREDAKKIIGESDHIVFACLAIRGNMMKTYSFAEDVLNSGKPFSVIAAGTSLAMSKKGLIQQGFSEKDKEIVCALSKNAQVFSTRGYLTQSFLKSIGAQAFEYCGDVAFGVSGKAFSGVSKVKKILVSDPHNKSEFMDAFEDLVLGIRKVFPGSEILCARHGVDGNIENKCSSLGVPILPLYKSVDALRKAYSECDLHVGFRVHGHVTALNQGKPSYLLEQDGRGADYGLSLGLRVSTPCFLTASTEISYREVLSRFIKRRSLFPWRPLPPAIAMILALVDEHAQQDFRVFKNIEPILNDIRERNNALFAKLCYSIG